MEEHEGPDFSHLPTDSLYVVFQQLFALDNDHPSGLPLSEFIQRWQAIRGTCRHWAEVLLAHPPPLYLGISTLPEDWLAWIMTLPVQTLRIQQGLDARWSLPDGVDGTTAEVEAEAGSSRRGPPPGMPGPVSALQLVAGLEGAGRPQPFWSLAPLSQLQTLHLQAPVSSPSEPAVFDSAALQGLDQLTQLSLGRFADFRLEQLPPSLRRLRLGYDSQNRTLSVPAVPEGISLDVLQVEKPGALGVCLDDWWGRVAELRLQAQELLLGVPVEDRRLIATFERPYREGNFVPPHIWGDEEADDKSKQAADMAANHMLTMLPSCGRLHSLCLSGSAAASVKFMPVRPGGGGDSLRWLWSVIRLQGMHNLYGLSGHELEARQQLFDDRLAFRHTQQQHGYACCIQIVRDADGAVPGTGRQLEPAPPANGEL